MSHIEIIDKYVQDCFLVLEVEHYNDDGSFWYMEHYRWDCIEGLKQKRQVNAEDKILLSDGSVAPVRNRELDDEPMQYCPDDKEWKYRDGPHMDDSSLWVTIIDDHHRRKEAGFNGGRNKLSRVQVSEQFATSRELGAPILVARFSDIVGDAVVL